MSEEVAFPKSVRVGPFTYDIKLVPGIQLGNDKIGWCLNDRLEIWIADDLCPQRTVEVLIHEVLHSAYHAGDLNDGDEEEKVVTVLSHQIMQIWRDNPDLILYIDDSLS